MHSFAAVEEVRSSGNTRVSPWLSERRPLQPGDKTITLEVWVSAVGMACVCREDLCPDLICLSPKVFEKSNTPKAKEKFVPSFAYTIRVVESASIDEAYLQLFFFVFL